MEKLITLTAVAAPINVDNMDTDQLMPKQFLRGIDKSGLAKGLLYNHRHLPDGAMNPNFVLNKPGFENTQIILAGPNFGLRLQPRTRRMGTDAIRHSGCHCGRIRRNLLFQLF